MATVTIGISLLLAASALATGIPWIGARRIGAVKCPIEVTAENNVVAGRTTQREGILNNAPS